MRTFVGIFLIWVGTTYQELRPENRHFGALDIVAYVAMMVAVAQDVKELLREL